MKTLLFLLIYPLSFVAVAQTITGKIENSRGGKILTANVLIKDSLNAEDIREFVVARNGEYKIVLTGNYTKFVLEVTAKGYVSEQVELGNLEKSATYVRNFVLTDEAEQIEEVVIKAQKNPFEVVGDTTKFDVQGYRDGTERKIEDIIKKLPGVVVNEKTGEIKYKNKSIETVKLDGDDLFGSNYAIGTRNINVDAVEQIQAIENYSANPLLKGIEDSDKVILNLKLKKGVDVSGGLEFGNGIAAGKRFARDVGTTLLAVTRKYKAFGNLSYNNIGINKTPFDYFSAFNYNPEQMKERNFFAQKLIPESGFLSALDDRRANINNTVFGSYNHTFKLGKRVSVKNNFYYISDKITSLQSVENVMSVGGQRFATSDETTITKKPLQLRSDMEVSINTSKTSLLEYKTRLRQENITTPNEVLQNGSNRFSTELLSKDFYFKQNVLFTQKLSPQKALQISLDHAQNNISQNYRLTPSIFDSLARTADEQRSQTQKSFVELKSTLLGSLPKSKYTISLGANIDNSPVQTSFVGFAGGLPNPIAGFENNFVYLKNSIFNQAVYNFKVKRWKIAPSYKVSYLQQQLSPEQASKTTQNDFIFEPALNIARKLNDVTALRAYYNFSQTPFSEERLYSNPITISQRAVSRNIPTLSFQKSNNVGASLYINDLYRLFQFNLGTGYAQTEGSYFSDIEITANRTQTTYFFLPQRVSSLINYLTVEQFFHKIFLLVKYNANYNIQNYKNIVNNSDLRNNQMKNFSNILELKTAFNIPLNFQNTFSYSRMLSRNEVSGSFLNQSWSNILSIVNRHGKNVAIVGLDYFVPNTQRPQENYLFVDCSYAFNFKNSPISLDFIAKNILNKSNFEQIQTSDFSVTTYRSNVLGRYMMARVSCSF